MATQSVRRNAGKGASPQRSAAARAAAKRVARAHPTEPSAPQPAAVPDAGAITPTTPDISADADADVDAQDTGRRRALLCAVLAVLVVLGLASSITLGSQYRDAERTRQARTAALAAARTAAPAILSYDYRRLHKDFAAARGHLTGPFVARYRKTTTTVVAPTAEKYKGVVKATVAAPPRGGTPAASVISESPDKVVVLLFMNQVTNSTQVSTPRLDLNRVRMTMVPADGTWKVSAVDAL
ncbi:hypothetical protein [Streptomyces sp. NPDC046805]|uniref:hypothetical protein n=1 Tax=Streptomyces sp. NPDC046805 TaxID=3155134 RepID=UPI0033DEF365